MNKQANGTIISLILGLVLLGILGYFGFQFMKTSPTNMTPTPAVSKGDIDRSGSADEEDRMMVRKQIGCQKDQPCWNTTIGKTKDGDNPLYVFDLDLNQDGTITQADVDLVK